jgi:hypothetical protein
MMPFSSHARRPALARLLVLAGTLTVAAAGCGGSSSRPASAGSQTKTVTPTRPEVSPSGDIPDSQAYVAYSPSGAGYSVKIPEGWSRTSSGGAVSFTDKLNRIQMEQQAAAAAPTPAQTRRSVIPGLAHTVAGFKLGTISSVSRSAGNAVRITYLARSAADPVTGKSHVDAVERYTFFHRGKIVVLTLSAPQGADNVDPWKTVTNSLRYAR